MPGKKAILLIMDGWGLGKTKSAMPFKTRVLLCKFFVQQIPAFHPYYLWGTCWFTRWPNGKQ
jgi:hypothetical protein